MLNFTTPFSNSEFHKCFIKTAGTTQFTTLEWPKNLESFTYTSTECMITKDEINNYLQGQINRGKLDKLRIRRTVEVRVIDLEWFFADKRNFVAFA